MLFLCVHVLIYSACTMPGMGKASGYCTSLSPKYIKGTGMPGMSLHVDAWHVHQCEHGKGKGTERM